MAKAAIESILERNRRVEEDKAWETSLTRRAIICAITYLVVVVFLYAIEAPRPWLSAPVPVLGFLLSTFTFPFFQRAWAARIHRQRRPR